MDLKLRIFLKFSRNTVYSGLKSKLKNTFLLSLDQAYFGPFSIIANDNHASLPLSCLSLQPLVTPILSNKKSQCSEISASFFSFFWSMSILSSVQNWNKNTEYFWWNYIFLHFQLKTSKSKSPMQLPSGHSHTHTVL